MNATLTLAIGMVRSWVALYTFGLPGELRSARRLEMASDVWEQRQFAALRREGPGETALQVLARLLCGVPADLTWRIETQLSTPTRSVNVNDSWVMRGLFVLALAVAIAPAALGIAVMSGYESEFNSTTERALTGLLGVVVSVAILSGLIQSTRRPVLGIGLVALGAITISVMLHWAAVIIAPIGAALVFLAFWRARGTGWPRGAGTA